MVGESNISFDSDSDSDSGTFTNFSTPHYGELTNSDRGQSRRNFVAYFGAQLLHQNKSRKPKTNLHTCSFQRVPGICVSTPAPLFVFANQFRSYICIYIFSCGWILFCARALPFFAAAAVGCVNFKCRNFCITKTELRGGAQFGFSSPGGRSRSLRLTLHGTLPSCGGCCSASLLF